MTLQRRISIFGFVTLSFLSLYILGTSSIFKTEIDWLSPIITIDVLLTIPLLYFLLIRKTSIPKITVIPITILGVLLATYIIPEDNQSLLSLFKNWALPGIELFVFCYVINKLRQSIKAFKVNSSSDSDFFTILKKTCQDNLPKLAVIPFVTEVSVFYYGFIYWKKRKLKANEFSYHKESGSLTLLFTFLFLIAIETFIVHLLLVRWNTTIAWILTGLSIYTGIQLFGFVKSILKRPIALTNDRLYLRYGIMTETEIKLKDIVSVELSSKDIDNDNFRKLSLLDGFESHNTIIHLNKTNTLVGLYGTKKNYKSIALSVDDYRGFKSEIIKAQSRLTNL
ncbi:MAG: hypothetical protein HKP48_00660 [Winogradskyella sp.]|uniref:hypothetical protein n=1 Tax=Winogradskyella sp. TaxID=1883156 RepID=UPI00183179B2|nr:hypothetical protein [Winogradskyella sp.]MBT8244869.1 hypothetical protein [Winogradskyella sp.]NNK21827.1 hypothetical protein [Winogradskyella sp.]